MKRHWTETLAEGTEVRMAFLAVDLAGGSKGTAEERRSFHRTVEQVVLEFGGALLEWHGEGSMGFFYDDQGWPEVAAFQAAQRILERLLVEHGLTSHLAVLRAHHLPQGLGTRPPPSGTEQGRPPGWSGARLPGAALG